MKKTISNDAEIREAMVVVRMSVRTDCTTYRVEQFVSFVPFGIHHFRTATSAPEKRNTEKKEMKYSPLDEVL